MKSLDYHQLGNAIKRVYLDSDNYQLSKDVPTFVRDGTYVGDFFNYTMFELDGTNDPIFYHIYSPYDIISGKSTQQAVVLRAGQIIMSTDFTPYMQQRTGVMSALVAQGLGLDDIGAKNILYIGVGTLAQRDLSAMKAYFPTITNVSYVSASGAAEAFTKLGDSLGVRVTKSDLTKLSDFDIIICHTNSKTPVLTTGMLDQVKPGAFIAAYSSEDSAEVATEFFNTDTAIVLIDWLQTVEEAAELKLAVEQERANSNQFITLNEVFDGKLPSDRKSYTIYRSHGTPMQNLAAMQLLMVAQSSAE